MSETKTYTAADIARYHSGELSAAERHALEKAALDDPFLADALEGYAATKTPVKDLTALQQKLQLRIEKEKGRRKISSIGTNWMRVAALFILIAVGGWAIVQLFGGKESKTENVATLKKPVNTGKNTVADSATVSSAAPLKTTPLSAETQKEYKRTTVAKNKSRTHRAVENKINDTESASSAFISAQDSVKELGYVTQQSAAAAGQKTEAFKKSIAEAKDKEQGNLASTTDTVKNFNVTLKRSDEGLQEVVVAKARKQPARRMNVTIDSLEPAEGWTNFDDYVASHLKEPEELKEKGMEGEVELSFEVNKEGEPVNIAVTQSLCAKCDEEAIRILKEGPKWKPKKKKGKIKIKFPAAP
ncbi:energy transducer TonB [Flavisolibacter ginsenosidimutans]|uniref:TonB C-terminal domain-containing protein n=1 Tax=Flavisolibacter ginsenosidimutans TaxID=661481 RepID=A0A5B8UIM3_9BACT|nr:energy transducer TonB [Flavisolibacter ginsenosidimutans]QEC55960.1 hypothetical protein FSB75_08645 [Flavisolibacter ginsenosidimutans]